MMKRWVDYATNGQRRFDRGELRIKYMETDEGIIYRIEDEVEIASGLGGTLSVVRPSYIFTKEVSHD